MLFKCLTCFDNDKEAPEEGSNRPVSQHKVRNWIGFWILGLSNHYAFFIMLAAAHDILTQSEPDSEHEFCNPLGTGTLLVADALPALTGIIVSPFLFSNTTVRILIAISLSCASFNVAGLSNSYVASFTAVVCGSFACGFGEASILAYATQFEKEIVSGWSSGTGASSVMASGVYLLLSLFLPSKQILLIMNIAPLLMATSYFIVLVHPDKEQKLQVVAATAPPYQTVSTIEGFPARIKARLVVVRHGLWYALPIFVTTFCMFFINQGLFELLFFHKGSIGQDMQYRTFSTLSAVGVFISRSSVQFVKIEKLWIFPMIQTSVLVLILAHIMHPFLLIYVVMVLVFLGGVFGGATYVNTFYKINSVCKDQEKAMITSMSLIGNEFAVATAGFVAIPAHDALCSLIHGQLSPT